MNQQAIKKESQRFSIIFTVLNVFLRNGHHYPTLPNFKGWRNNEHPLTIRKQAWKTMRHGVKLGEVPISSLPSYRSPALRVSIAVVFKRHIQINLFDKWREVWDLSRHGDGNVVTVFINHPLLSWDNTRLVCGCLWFRRQGWEHITILLRSSGKQIVGASTGPEIMGVLQI